jgi:hypothetical protein
MTPWVDRRDVVGEAGENSLPRVGRGAGMVVPPPVIEESVLRSLIHLEVVRDAGRRQLD